MSAFGNETAAQTGARHLGSKQITVTAHAVVRARARRHYDGLTGLEISDRIATDVQAAVAARRVSSHRPVWATVFSLRELGGAKPKQVPCGKGRRFVWDEGEAHGWIVRDDDAGGLVVITSLHRVRAEQAA